MNKNVFYFIAAFAIGCVAALAARSAWFKPYADHSGHPPATDYQQMVTNPAAPAAGPHAGHPPASSSSPKPSPAPTTAPADPHAGHGAAAPGPTVNTLCTICGMDVDPTIKPAVYQGKLIGFGCRLCPPKFAANPDRYGPAALENKVISK